jgi:copper transport protein
MMTTWITLLRRAIVSALLAMVCVLLLAAPGSAHAELVQTTPTNGQRLDTAPAQVTLVFSESVNLLDGGISLLNSDGVTVSTPDPTVDGHTVTWPMPRHLRNGPYVVTWRVISADGHPVEGAFSFGVGAAARAVPGAVTAAQSTAQTAPWQVVGVRLVGYLAFAVVAGVVAFLVWCAPDKATNHELQRLTRWALSVGLVATLVGILVQGPYTVGVSMGRLLEPHLVATTMRTPWGIAMAWRFAMLLMLTALIWRLYALSERTIRWVAAFLVVLAAAAIAAAGHGDASGSPLDLGIVTLHVLTAGIWVGGLVVLVVLGRTVERRAVRQFSVLAMTSVVVLVATGILNSLRNLHSFDQLFLTRYGLLLFGKVLLVAATLAAAAVSRAWVRRDRLPRGSVRLEAGLTVAVLTVTAFLSMTSPPPQVAATTTAGDNPADANPASANGLALMSLGHEGSAGMGIIPATTSGSRLHLLLTDLDGQPLRATDVELKVSNPARNVGGIPVPMIQRNGVWVARFRFPFAGDWKAVLTVHDDSPTAIVTGGDFTITQ